MCLAWSYCGTRQGYGESDPKTGAEFLLWQQMALREERGPMWLSWDPDVGFPMDLGLPSRGTRGSRQLLLLAGSRLPEQSRARGLSAGWGWGSPSYFAECSCWCSPGLRPLFKRANKRTIIETPPPPPAPLFGGQHGGEWPRSGPGPAGQWPHRTPRGRGAGPAAAQTPIEPAAPSRPSPPSPQSPRFVPGGRGVGGRCSGRHRRRSRPGCRHPPPCPRQGWPGTPGTEPLHPRLHRGDLGSRDGSRGPTAPGRGGGSASGRLLASGNPNPRPGGAAAPVPPPPLTMVRAAAPGRPPVRSGAAGKRLWGGRGRGPFHSTGAPPRHRRLRPWPRRRGGSGGAGPGPPPGRWGPGVSPSPLRELPAAEEPAPGLAGARGTDRGDGDPTRGTDWGDPAGKSSFARTGLQHSIASHRIPIPPHPIPSRWGTLLRASTRYGCCSSSPIYSSSCLSLSFPL